MFKKNKNGPPKFLKNCKYGVTAMTVLWDDALWTLKKGKIILWP